MMPSMVGHSSDRDEARDLAERYVLGALDGEDRLVFEIHLAEGPPAVRFALANAAQIAQVPGRKTDVKDCVWNRATTGARARAGRRADGI